VHNLLSFRYWHAYKWSSKKEYKNTGKRPNILIEKITKEIKNI